MKKIFYFISSATLLISCGKENTFSTNFSSASFIHASPGTPAFDVLEDTVKKHGGSISLGGWSNYLGFVPGEKKTNIRRADNLEPLFSGTFTYNFGQATTFIVYDTLVVGAGGSLTGNLRVARLTDNLTLPDAGRTHVRFVHVAQNAPAVDVTLVRLGGTPAAPIDSVTLTNRAYIGSSPSAASLAEASTFSSLPFGNYSVRVKLAGTQTLARSPQTFTLANGGLYTILAVGTARNVPLTAVSIRNL
jgi:hypothetical protein